MLVVITLSSTGTWDNSYAELFYIDLSCVTTIDVQAFVERKYNAGTLRTTNN